MADVLLTKQERQRFEEMNDALGWRFPISVKEMFNRAGRSGALNAAITPEEQQIQRECGTKLFGKNGDYHALRATDVFLAVARRVNKDDAALAGLLPKNKFRSGDVALLEKYSLTSLAALVRLSV